MAVAVGGATVGTSVGVGALVGAAVATGGRVAVEGGGVLPGAGVAAGGAAQATSQNNRRKDPHRFMTLSIQTASIFRQQGAV